jgi:hypothetical protein
LRRPGRFGVRAFFVAKGEALLRVQEAELGCEECLAWRRSGGATSGTYRRARDGSPPSRPAQGTPSLPLRTDGRVSPLDKAGLAPLFLRMEDSLDHPSFGAPGGSAGFFAVTSVRGPEGRLKEG